MNKIYRHLLLIFFSFMLCIGTSLMNSSSAYELVYIQKISQSQRTFVTRQGKEQGISEGMEANFTTPYVSLVAKAVSVSREFTQWKLMEPGARVPFVRGQLVTYQGSTEGIWSLDPDRYFFLVAQGEKEKLPLYLQDQRKIKEDALFLQSISCKGLLSNGLSQSVSLTNSAQIRSREGSSLEVLYERKVFSRFYLGGGVRKDVESTDTPSIIVESERTFAFLDLSYHFNPTLESQAMLFYLGAAAGLGVSKTTVAHEQLNGRAILLPSVRAGLEFLLPYQLALQLEVSAESISVRETFSDGDDQTSNFVNSKIGLGLKRYF